MRIRMMQSTSKLPIWADLVQQRVRVKRKKKKRLIWCSYVSEQKVGEESSKVPFPVWDAKSKSVQKKKDKCSFSHCSSSLNIIVKVKRLAVT